MLDLSHGSLLGIHRQTQEHLVKGKNLGKHQEALRWVTGALTNGEPWKWEARMTRKGEDQVGRRQGWRENARKLADSRGRD